MRKIKSTRLPFKPEMESTDLQGLESPLNRLSQGYQIVII